MDGWNCVDLVLARPKPEIRPEFLVEFMNWSRSNRVLQGLAPGTKQKHLSVAKLERFLVPAVSLACQDAVVDKLRQVRAVAEASAKRAVASADLLRAAIDHTIGVAG
jgi:hypothetical protein